MAPKDDPQMLETLRSWNAAMVERLGFDGEIDEESMQLLLSLTGSVAHEVVRPAAPFATLFVGWLLGSGRAATLDEAAVMVAEALRSPNEGDGARTHLQG